MTDINVVARPIRLNVRAGAPTPIRVDSTTAQRIGSTQHNTVVRPSNPKTEAVIKDVQNVRVDTGGKQGLPGPQGPIGPAGGTTIEKMAAMPLGGHRIVRSTGVNMADYADNRYPEQGDDILGLTLSAASSGSMVAIANGNEVTEPSWNWIPQQPIFLGENGTITQTPPDPDGTAAFIVEVGFAQSPTTMMVRIGTSIYF